jgi:hypothetical protein
MNLMKIFDRNHTREHLNLEIAKPTTKSNPVDIDRLNDSGARAQQLKP